MHTLALAALLLAAQPADDPHRHLDFWLGQWDVYLPSGDRAGSNSITSEDNGNLVLESWRSAKGGTGHSMTFIDPASKQWRQIWVSSSGSVLDMQGAFTDGAMRLQGVHTAPDGSAELHKTTLTPLPQGRVRQYIEQSKDQGQTWYVWFDAVYVPQGQPFTPEPAQ